MQTKSVLFAVLAAAVVPLMVSGCMDLNTMLAPVGLSGMMSAESGYAVLAEPVPQPEAPPCAGKNAYKTMAAPVRLNVPDRDVLFAVGSVRGDLHGTAYVEATFAGGKIVEREFGKVLERHFRPPAEGETPVAELEVRIATVAVAQKSRNAPVKTRLKIIVDVNRPDGGGPLFSKSIEREASAPWPDRSLVPPSFYEALSGAIGVFCDEWDRSGGPDTVARLAGETAPGTVAPELREIAWETGQDAAGIQRGRCTILCNGFEGFRAKHWANAQIAEACRSKLGNIEPQRVRVLYDEESYDAAAKKWSFAFRCFARSERVLDFNAQTGCGTVVGDWELMGMSPEQAAEDLKAHVLEEMKSHSGIVTSQHRAAEAYVRFDNFKTDPHHNLIRIDFRLLR